MKRSLLRNLAATALLCGGTASATDGFYRPSPGNLYVTTTDRYLYVVWAVPRDLTPFAAIRRQDELDAYVARTAIFLCAEHRARVPDASRACRVQVVQMNSNDEYTRSAAGGFRTIARLLLPLAAATPEAHRRAQTQGIGELRPLFTQFDLRPGAIPLAGRP
jgi:hypothetical protein